MANHPSHQPTPQARRNENTLEPRIRTSSTHPLIHSSTHPLIHSSTHPLIHSSTHPLIHSSTHPFIHSSIHPLSRLHEPLSQLPVAVRAQLPPRVVHLRNLAGHPILVQHLQLFSQVLR